MSILALGRKQKKGEILNQKGERKPKKKKKRKILNQRIRESKKRKFPIKERKKTKEISRKVFGPDNI